MLTEKLYTLMREYQGMESTPSQELMVYPMQVRVEGGSLYVTFDTELKVITVYVGEDALQGQLRLVQWLTNREDRDSILLATKEAVADTPYLELRFSEKEALTEDELALCEEMEKKSAGTEKSAGKKRGRKKKESAAVYPLLRLWRPHRLGEVVTDEQQLSWAEEAMEAVLWYRRSKKRMPNDDDLGKRRALLCVHREGESFVREQDMPIPEVQKKIWPLQPVSTALDQKIQEMKKQEKGGVWEILLMENSSSEARASDGSVLASCANGRSKDATFLIAEQESEAVIDPDELQVEDFADNPGHLLEKLTQLFIDNGACPGQVVVMDDQTDRFLRQWCKRAGVKLSHKDTLPTLKQVFSHPSDDQIREMRKVLLMEAQEPDPEKRTYTNMFQDMAEEIEAGLEQMSSFEVRMIPDDIRDSMHLVGELGFLSDAAMKKLEPGEAEPTPEEMADLLMQMLGEPPRKKSGARKSSAKKSTAKKSGKKSGAGRRGPGSYVFSVSPCTGVYRHMQVNADATLEEFGDAILEAFEFWDTWHLSAFFLYGHAWNGDEAIWCKEASMENDPWSDVDPDAPTMDEVQLSELGLEKGRKMIFLFDFGDDWRFTCKVLRAEAESVSGVKILRSKGAVEQYPEWDEEDEDYDDEDDE